MLYYTSKWGVWFSWFSWVRGWVAAGYCMVEGRKEARGRESCVSSTFFFFFSFFIFQFFFSFDGIFCNASVVPRKFSHFRGLNSRVTNYYVHVQYVLRRAEVWLEDMPLTHGKRTIAPAGVHGSPWLAQLFGRLVDLAIVLDRRDFFFSFSFFFFFFFFGCLFLRILKWSSPF